MALNECFFNLKQNKVTKNNVWHNHFIDDFKDLIANHHNTLGNFPLVGSMLEACSEIYGMKVDTLHGDVLRMCNGVRRETILESPNESVASEMSSIIPPRTAPRNKRRANTIVGNKELINAPLQTIEEPNPQFGSFSSSIGMGISTKNLLQNVLPSHQSALSLNTKRKFFISQDVLVNEMDDSSIYNEACVELPALHWEPAITDVIRPKITAYTMSDAPQENNWNPAIENHVENMNHSGRIELSQSTASSTDFQFYINAEVEPMELSDHHVHSDIGGIGIESFTQDDQNALERCSGLRREGIRIDDLRPVNASSPSEYSYRRLPAGNNQFWAGPSYWKVPPAKQSNNSSRNFRARRNNNRNKNQPIKLSAVTNENINRHFMPLHGGQISVRKACTEKWEQQKLKLPHDFKYESNRFSCLPLAQGILIDTGIRSGDSSLPNLHRFERSDVVRRESIANCNDVDMNIDADVLDLPESTIQDIVMNDNAEDQFEQLNVPNIYSRRSIDMKQLKMFGWRIIQNGARSFSSVYKELDKTFGREVVTPGVVLSTILELANENHFHLKKIDGNDFIIELEARLENGN